MSDAILHPASYKDPSGFIFTYQNSIHRQVNRCYATHYDLLQQSGLYDVLIKKKWLIPHRETPDNINNSPDWYKTLIPDYIPFISYPYEWSFDMLKDAALLTLDIARKAISFGMILKDATPFNIQFLLGKPVLIDTLSFEKYDERQPWIAYRQFCECFLFPLYIAHYTGTDAMKLLAIYPDGISADIVSRLLPFRSRFDINVWMHVFLQKRFQREENTQKSNDVIFNEKKLLLLIAGLRSSVEKLTINSHTIWENYYSESILSQQYLQNKEIGLHELIKRLPPLQTVIDIGANDGYFAKIMRDKAKTIIAADFDSQCIGALYKYTKANKIQTILPLIIDLANPSPAIGFDNRERDSFLSRIKGDLLLALAIVHHLVIGKNIPLQRIAKTFSDIATYTIVEFIPLEDEKVKMMLSSRRNIYQDYNEANFRKTFEQFFDLIQFERIPETRRSLYLFKKIAL